MLGYSMKRFIVYTLIAHLTCLGLVPSVQAGIVATESALALEQRQGRLERINAALLRDDVRGEMLRLGAAPSEVQSRLAALTDQELERIEGELDTLPAGGNVAAAIGVAFIVLIILELVGVIDIFKKL
jgi:uncharacterized membrane protein (Fun14 family)